jgi:iron complex outermembrane receptor protein
MKFYGHSRLKLVLCATTILGAVHPAFAQTASGSDNTAINAGSVSAAGTQQATGGFAASVLTKKKLQHQSQSVTSIDKSDLNLFAPSASGLQALTIKPGIVISGYNASSGTARSTVSMRGVKVGWNSVPGDLETNGITAMLDGIPLNSLIQGTGWHSTEIPMGALLSGTNVIYGPGNPRDRWYDSLGGTINFIPIQPTATPQANISASYGSHDQQNYSLYASSGVHDGWSSILAYAHAFSHTFRTGEYNRPSRADQLFFKLRKSFEGGHISIGAYWQHSNEQRPNDVPVDPIPGVTIAGLNVAGAPLYSQKTTGFYSDLPNYVWFKENQIQNYIGYIKFDKDLGDGFHLNNITWYRHGSVIHYRINPGFQAASLNDSEYYNPYSDTFGDKLTFDTKLPFNTLSYGGYFIYSHTVDRYRGYQSLSYQGSTPTSLQMPFTDNESIYDNLFAAVFVQDDIAPIAGLHIVPGVQLVNYGTSFYNNNAAFALQYPPQNPGNSNPSVNKDFQRVQPSIGVTYDVTPWLTPYANFAVTYQNPTAGNFNNAQTDLPSLKPVKSTDYEIGVRMVKDGIFGLQSGSASVSYYHDYLSDQTIPISLANNPTVTTFGYGSATLQGVNAELQADYNFNWMAFANFGFFSGKYNSYFSTTTQQSYNGAPVSNTPSLTSNIGFKYRTFIGANELTASVYNQYFGHSYMFDNSIGAPTKRKIPAYDLVNLAVSVTTPWFNRFVPKLGEAKFSLNITNALDRRYNSTEYVSAGGYFGGAGAGSVIANPAQGRAVYGTVSLTF